MSSAVELSERNVESVLGLSVRYGVSALVEQCCGFLAGSISVSNAFGILTVADVSPPILQPVPWLLKSRTPCLGGGLCSRVLVCRNS